MSFGDSKHKPVKPLQSLLDVTPLKLALSAKCTIHDVCAQHEQCTPIRKLEKNIKNTNKVFNSLRMGIFFSRGVSPLNAGISAQKF